jgi:lysine-N-methylase
MASRNIDIPTIQNWSCHGCGACCSGGMVIPLTTEDAARIQSQGWKPEWGVNPAATIVNDNTGSRLGHKPDGTCVFLDENKRCRIHARFGEPAKPRACRVFPLALHPAGHKLAAGLRFSCPSAAANIGRPLSAQLPQWRELADLIVPEGFEKIPPPPVARRSPIAWPDFLRYTAWLDKILAAPGFAFEQNLLAALFWTGELELAEFDQLTGPGADEILSALVTTAREKAMNTGSSSPTALGRLLFRTLAFVYARKDTVADLHAGLGRKFKLLRAAGSFALGKGPVPPLRPECGRARLEQLDCPIGLLSTDVNNLLTRFFRVKVQGLHFCGAAYYNVPLVEGFQSLALLFPVILWMARWHTLGEGRDAVTPGDVVRAVSMVDHHHGYSPILGGRAARQRVRILAQRGDIARLIAWHTRP